MTFDQLFSIISSRCGNATRDGNAINAGGHLNLGSLTSLPDGVTLTAGGHLNLGSLTSLPDGVTLTAGGSLYLGSLTSLPDGVTLTAGGSLDLGSLTSLPDGVTLTAGGYLDLRSLTSLPDGVTLTAGGSLDLGSLTSLPDGVTLTAGGYLYARLSQSWRGQTLVTVDGIVSVARTPQRMVGDVQVQKATYFHGETDGEEHYIARIGEHSAHGKTLQEAIEDVRYKLIQSDPDGVVRAIREIRETQSVTLNQYRAITGACREGCRNWMESHGVTLETESLPIGQVLEMLRDDYGAEKFRELIGG